MNNLVILQSMNLKFLPQLKHHMNSLPQEFSQKLLLGGSRREVPTTPKHNNVEKLKGGQELHLSMLI